MVDANAFTTLQTNALLLRLSKKLDTTSIRIIREQNPFLVCMRYGETNASDTYGSNPKVVNYMNNQNHQGNYYSNAYNLGRMNHHNFA